MAKYNLFKAIQNTDNSEYVERFDFYYSDVDFVWIYTNKKIRNSCFTKVNIEKENLDKYIMQWICESNIMLAKQKMQQSQDAMKEGMNFLEIFNEQLSKIKEDSK
jgi:hypothetical protein|nr:MAG TPA: hypothetical protein [Caudoviricetes sp.]